MSLRRDEHEEAETLESRNYDVNVVSAFARLLTVLHCCDTKAFDVT
jgi:hypothetical protein